jgi:hypothetical protein
VNTVRVWYDRKRGHYVSDVGFVLGKQWGVHPAIAATIFLEHLKEQPQHEIWQHVEKMWVS